MLNTGECPNVVVESTLSQILQVNVPQKYYLSPKACLGILRRAMRRGKELPTMLEEALVECVRLGGEEFGPEEIADAGEILQTLWEKAGAQTFIEWIRRTVVLVQQEKVLNSAKAGLSDCETSPTIKAANGGEPAIALDCRNMVGNEELSGTLQAKNEGGFSLNYINPVVYDARGNGDGNTALTLTGDHAGRVTDYTAVCIGNGQMCNITMQPVANTLDCMHDQQAVLTNGKSPRKYIVRRLTPTECARLQGFPDAWGEVREIKSISDDDLAKWEMCRKGLAEIQGKEYKPKSTESLVKWLNGLHTDSAEYKMWGNGIALPCAADVLSRIKREFDSVISDAASA